MNKIELEKRYINVLTKGWERGLYNGWEPPDVRSPVIVWAVENGFLRVTDARCGFELIKDAFVVWTAAGKLAMESMSDD